MRLSVLCLAATPWVTIAVLLANTSSSAQDKAGVPLDQDSRELWLLNIGSSSAAYLYDLSRHLDREIMRAISENRKFPSGVEYFMKLSPSSGEPPMESRSGKVFGYTSHGYRFLEKDGFTPFAWSKYVKVEIWIDPKSGINEQAENTFVGIGWVGEVPERIQGVMKLFLSEEFELDLLKEQAKVSHLMNRAKNESELLKEKGDVAKRALRYVTELDRILVKDVQDFISKEGDKPFPSGIEFIEKVKVDVEQRIYNIKAERTEVSILTVDEAEFFRFDSYKDIQLWKRPVEVIGGPIPLIGIGWPKNDGQPELIECVMTISF